MTLKFAALLIAAAVGCASPARCEDAPNYSHPPYQHPFEATLRAAEHGDVAAQVQLGRDYEKALGVEQDFERAVDWYREAANAGSPQAMLALGLLFQDWNVAQKFNEKPEPWLLRAAQTGLAAALVAEAKFHNTSDSPEEKKTGKEWLERAVAQGDLEAMSMLGPMLASGDDPSERKRGEEYVSAAEKAYPRTKVAAEAGKIFRAHPASEFPTAQVPEEFRRAALALDIEEAGNDAWEGFAVLFPVMAVAGSFNFDDSGLRGGSLVLERLEAAAGSGDLQSACNLAFAKLGERKVESYKEAFDWYLSAAKRGAPRAQYHLGKLYRDGLGTDANASNAAKWFYQSALHAYPPAEAALGDLLLHGNGVPTDYQAALGWLRPAAAYGNPMAQYDLGWMYLNGLGVKKDSDRATALIAAAAEPIGLKTWSPAADWLKKAKSDPAMSRQIAAVAKVVVPHRHDVDTAQGGCDEQSINSKIEE
jgi:TPR repeat protein